MQKIKAEIDNRVIWGKVRSRIKNIHIKVILNVTSEHEITCRKTKMGIEF